MRALKQFLLVLVVLSLPLQGLMAATMPLCLQPAKAETMAHTDHALHHADQAQHHGQHEQDQTGSHCNDCNLCQVCASPALTATALHSAVLPAAVPEQHPASQYLSFFPEVFQRPPLTLGT